MDEPGFGKAEAPVKRSPLFRIEGVKLRTWPILFTILLGFGIPVLAELIVLIVQHFVDLPDRPANPWMEYYYGHAAQLVLALIAIVIMKGFVKGDYGVHAPRGDSYVGAAIFWGILFGVMMTLVDYWPQIAAHRAPSAPPYELTPLNVTGWLSFEGIFVGPSEELLFRGLLVTYLASAIPGRISFLRFEMNAAGVIVALIFALAHVYSFVGHPFWIAFGQQFYAFALGVLYAYWFEKSRSLLAPIVGHNVSDLTEFILIFAMVAAWY
ncbi:MAG: CPBP family intramembrane glutamic endopeptidase [Rhizomicrobium sp.]|jgi:membrane protease YdiL (CAAX protease family)